MYLSFHGELVADVHDPLEEGSPHHPGEVLLALLNVIGRKHILALPVVQMRECLALRCGVERLHFCLEFLQCLFYLVLRIRPLLFFQLRVHSFSVHC